MEIKKEKITVKLTEKEKEAIEIVKGMGDYIYDNDFCVNKPCCECPLEHFCNSEDIVEDLEEFLNED